MTMSDAVEAPPRYTVGIDLGTTNSAVAYIDTTTKQRRVVSFPVLQVTAPGEAESLETLPSFHYEPAAAELGDQGAVPFELAWGPPWGGEPPWVVGVYARQRGARVPGRLVGSAKSWLSHSRVDRRASLLPLHGAPDLRKISPSDLADRVGVTRATMTGLLDTLARDGWIERIQHNDDRRRVVVRLTREGLEHLGRMLPGYFREFSSIMAGLNEQERQTLIKVLGKVREGLSAHVRDAKS